MLCPALSISNHWSSQGCWLQSQRTHPLWPPEMNLLDGLCDLWLMRLGCLCMDVYRDCVCACTCEPVMLSQDFESIACLHFWTSVHVFVHISKQSVKCIPACIGGLRYDKSMSCLTFTISVLVNRLWPRPKNIFCLVFLCWGIFEGISWYLWIYCLAVCPAYLCVTSDTVFYCSLLWHIDWVPFKSPVLPQLFTPIVNLYNVLKDCFIHYDFTISLLQQPDRYASSRGEE